MSDMCKSADKHSKGLPSHKIKCQSLEIGDTIGAGEGSLDSVIRKIECGWKKLRDLVPM